MADPEEERISVNEIYPGLWLGNQAAATSDFVPLQGIRTVINCTTHVPCQHAALGVKYVRLGVYDPGPGQSLVQADVRRMAQHLPALVEVITQERKAGRPILVHCHAGAQRSACVVVAYLFSLLPRRQRTRANLARLIEVLIRKRPRAFFGGESVNFYPALVHYQRSIGAA